MGIQKSSKSLAHHVEKCIEDIWTNLLTNNLWQRILKNTVATTITVILALLPAIVNVWGRASYLAPLVTVFGHPGRRFGMMAEALVLVLFGTALGLGWSLLGLYLSSLVSTQNAAAAYTIKGIFMAIATIFHGFLRSHTPRLFLGVLLYIIVVIITFCGQATQVSSLVVTTLAYPILSAVAILLLVNTLLFPEFSSSFLGITTIETLGETVGVLRNTGEYFVHTLDSSPEGQMKDDILGEDGRLDGTEKPTLSRQRTTLAEKSTKNQKPAFLKHVFSFFDRSKNAAEPPKDSAPKNVNLKLLTGSKAKLRAKLASCKAAQQECNFELTYAVLPPHDLKPISVASMKSLVANVIALVGACESKYALMGDADDNTSPKTNEEGHPQAASHEANTDVGDDVLLSSPRLSEIHDDSDDVQSVSSSKRGRKKKKPRTKSRQRDKSVHLQDLTDLELVKPKKEIESGDAALLRHLVNRIAAPLAKLQETIDRSVDVVTSCLAYCYDVPRLPSGAAPPKGIELEEIDIRVQILTAAILDFDKDSAFALEGAAALQGLGQVHLDVMPRMETFLISSFLLNLRQAALHTLEMLKASRTIVAKRQARHGRRRLYAPSINWRKWLRSGGEQDQFALPETGRKDARAGRKVSQVPSKSASSGNSKNPFLRRRREDIELGSRENGRNSIQSVNSQPEPVKDRSKGTIHKSLWWRNKMADIIEYLVDSEDVIYAIKITVAVFLVTFPAFVQQWNAWYYISRGVWAALQLVLITEVALGTSVMTFVIRAAGTTVGCLWGYAAYNAGSGNTVICVVMLVIGIIPSTYMQLGSKYVKAGMVSTISMCIVALSTIDQTFPGTATEHFLKRMIAFIIGAAVALTVQVVLFPVKARDRLVESLATSIHQIIEMEACLAYGVETETNVPAHNPAVHRRFTRAKSKTEAALAAAATFLPFCANEPRLKGSFKGLALIYAEILYVLHAIIDRMDNMIHLRHEYGSGVLEELNTQVFPYRRNVAGAITLILYAVHEALTTKLPLPQFLPSARLAHLRMVNRVREVVGDGTAETGDDTELVKRVLRQKYLSWNAASAGQIEVIEYLEELCELVKLLVGADEFRSGMLTRPKYQAFVGKDEIRKMDVNEGEQEEQNYVKRPGLTKRALTALRNPDRQETKGGAEDGERLAEELPISLQMVRTRRVEELSKRDLKGNNI